MHTFFLSLSVLLLAGSSFLWHIHRPGNTPTPSTKMATTKRKALKEENQQEIPWSARRIIAWSDFQGNPKSGTEAVASTSTTLTLTYKWHKGALDYSIHCAFSKSQSWGSLKTDYILAHEQLHFDITEICARKLHERLAGYSFNRRSHKSDLSRIYKEVVTLKESLQEQYDRETDHSRQQKAQEAWETRIEQMLTATEAWAGYP